MIATYLDALFNFIILVIGSIGYPGIFFLMTLQSLNIPIPSEIIMPFSGFLVQRGDFNFWLVVFCGALGSLAGSLASYKSASFLLKNGYVREYPFLKIFINPKNLKLAEEWFLKYGSWSIFFGRMIPVLSTFISFPAGLARMKIYKFSALTFSGALLWSIFLTWLGFILGENWKILSSYFRKFDYLILGIIIIFIIIWIWRHFLNNNNDNLADKKENGNII